MGTTGVTVTEAITSVNELSDRRIHRTHAIVRFSL